MKINQTTLRKQALERQAHRAPEKIADAACTFLMLAAALYFFGHILAAWMRGSFEVIR